MHTGSAAAASRRAYLFRVEVLIPDYCFLPLGDVERRTYCHRHTITIRPPYPMRAANSYCRNRPLHIRPYLAAAAAAAAAAAGAAGAVPYLSPSPASGRRCRGPSSCAHHYLYADTMGKKTRGAAKGQSRPSSSASNSSPSAIERNDLTSIVLNSMEAAADKMGLCEDEKTKYLSCARILVIEVVHQSVFGIVNYRRLAGEMGGLNPIKRPYIKRIILAVDGPEGVYGAAHLDRNVHYQIGIEELADYFDDLHRHKFPVYNAASAPPPEMDCCVLCLPDQSHVLKDEYFSLGATDFLAKAAFDNGRCRI